MCIFGASSHEMKIVGSNGALGFWDLNAGINFNPAVSNILMLIRNLHEPVFTSWQQWNNMGGPN